MVPASNRRGHSGGSGFTYCAPSHVAERDFTRGESQCRTLPRNDVIGWFIANVIAVTEEHGVGAATSNRIRKHHANRSGSEFFELNSDLK